MSSRCEQLALQHAIAQAEFELAYQDAAIAEFPQGTRVRWMIVGHPQFAWASGTVMRTGGMLALVRSDDGNLHELEYSWLQLVAKAPAGAPARAWYLPPAGLRHDAQRHGQRETIA